jgi:hypothetical protein
MYASGLKLGPALILNQNPFFEIASTSFETWRAYIKEILSNYHVIKPDGIGDIEWN